ncbi:MAG: hypothetical protein ABEJ07_04785 [Candidatus Nanohaloarchaea archaeon]
MRARKKFYRNTLFVLLAVTRALHRADFNLPVKWYSMLDSLRVSSGVLHERIGMVDPEVEEEFREVEKQFDRRIGKKKFYSEEELQELQGKINEIKL